MTAIPDPVRIAARERPDAPAVIAPGETLSYADLDRRVDGIAAALHAHGLSRGDRLTVYRSADVDYLVLLLAAFRAGIVVCPLNTRQPVAAVPALLERIACRTLVAEPDPAWGGFDVIEAEYLTSYRRPGGASLHEPSDWRLDAPATLVFTSGSTGTPKAALHTLGNHVMSARGSVAFFGFGPGDRWLLDLPLYHVGGLAVLVRCVLAGAAVVLPTRGVPVEETVAAHGVTHASFVATQLLRIVQSGGADALVGMKAILLGGSAIPPGLVADAHALGLPISTSYGLSEMASTVAATSPGASLDALGTSGVVLPHRELKLAGDGEILVRGATLFAGYAEGEAVERPDADGWFPTGDLGAWAGVEGMRMLRVVGRKDHLFISGGENVQPEEVEAALGRLAGVHRAIVVPVADAEFGQRPVVFVDAEAWEPEAWRDGLGETVARFKIPVAFHPWPGDADGEMKVSRAALRERATSLQLGKGASRSDHTP
ncbi:MAG: o-succinylbenzoate--CoA ligase [Rhodothermales bacterium]